MFICTNKIRNNYGDIVAFVLLGYYGLQVIEKDELIKMMSEHKIYVDNLELSKDGIISMVDKGIFKNHYNVNNVLTKTHWFPGGVIHGHKLKILDEFRTKFNIIIAEGEMFASKIEKEKNIPYIKKIYKDTMDCEWYFYNGTIMHFNKFEGKLFLSNFREKNFEFSGTPKEILEIKFFN